MEKLNSEKELGKRSWLKKELGQRSWGKGIGNRGNCLLSLIGRDFEREGSSSRGYYY